MGLTIKEKFNLLQSGRTFKAEGHTFKADSKGDIVNEVGGSVSVDEWGCMVLIDE